MGKDELRPEYKKVFWTEHAKFKMRQHGLSKSKVMRVLYKPERREEGIAQHTTALMSSSASYKKLPLGKKIAGEIWLMYQDDKSERKIISAWRYPGITKPGDIIPIPEDSKQELSNI